MRNLSKIEDYLFFELDPAYKRRAKIVLESLDLSSKSKVLDVGSGRGFYLRAILDLWPNTTVFGIDKNPKYVSQAKHVLAGTKAQIINSDATSLPFDSDTMDAVICSELLEHVLPDKAILNEIYRVLKPGGKAILTVPSATYPFWWDPINWILERLFKKHVRSDIWWLAGIWADHVRLYTKKDLMEKVSVSGLKINQVNECTTICIPFAHFLLYGIGKNIVELGLAKEFNRFEQHQYNQKPSLVFNICSRIINLWDKKNDQLNIDRNQCVNLVVVARKPSGK